MNSTRLARMTIVYLNGELLPKERAAISVDDRGFIFGDGIYEGVRAIRGRLFEWPAHSARMSDGLAGLRIDLPADRVMALGSACEQLLAANALTDGEAFVYLQVTRGAGPRTHAFPPPGTRPTVFISANRVAPHRELHQKGCAAILFDDMRWARCDWKTINLLGSVLGRQAAAEAGAYEAILVRDGVITEGAASTVLAVVDGALRTHPLGPRILPSVTRKLVLACAAELAISVDETALTVDELVRADEILLCGTMSDVMSVVQLDGKPVAGGAPGQIASRLREAYSARLYALAGG
jgi:D-alanine transaminase